MDSSFVWILMCAGAAVALLGLFLVTSERELKKKRREVAALVTKLEEASAAGAAARARTERAEAQIGDREKTADSATADRQAEIAALRQSLVASQAKIRELEAAQQKAAHLETVEADQQRERQSLHERIAELEARLAADQESLSELQDVRDRLAEAERGQAALQQEIRRYEAEIPGWQTRLAAAEQYGHRLAGLQRGCDDLLTKQAALAEGHRRFQEELAAFGRLIGTALSAASSPIVARASENGLQDS
jgi:chromosome segregation ATPase